MYSQTQSLFISKHGRRACLDYNIRIERDQFTSWIGHSGIELSTFLIETYDLSVQTDDFIFQQHRHFLDIIKDGLYCFPDLKGLLEKMDERIPKGIVTSGTRYLAGRVLKILDLENFLPLLVTIEDVEHPKPAPDAYITASYALGLRPEECIAVEDSPFGYRIRDECRMLYPGGCEYSYRERTRPVIQGVPDHGRRPAMDPEYPIGYP